MTDKTEQQEQPRKKLTLGGRPKLGLKPSAPKPTSQPVEAEGEPVVARRRKKLVVANTAPRRKPKPKPEPETKPEPKPAPEPKRELTPEEMERRAVVEARRKQVKRARKWLTTRFPVVFNPADPKPLALNTSHLLGVALKADGGAEATGFGWNALKKVMKKWVHCENYQKALAAEDAVRYNIVTGLPDEDTGEVTKQHHKAAKFRYNSIRYNKKKENEAKYGSKEGKSQGQSKPFKPKARKPNPASESK